MQDDAEQDVESHTLALCFYSGHRSFVYGKTDERGASIQEVTVEDRRERGKTQRFR